MRHLTATIERWPLARPFRISRGVKIEADVLVVTVDKGRGEAVPYARYDETAIGVLAQVEAARDAIERGASRAELLALMPAGAARNAVDCALWDGEGAPTATGSIVTAMTIGLDTAERMAEAARALRDVPLVKVKVDARYPAATLRAVRQACPDAALIVDPNESWDIALLTEMQPVLAELGVAFVEQPLPAGDDAALEGFHPLVPNCADESVHTANDLDIVARRYGLVNIKLDKAGGLTAALQLEAAARARGLGVMVGCMICTSLSIAPAWGLAQRADFADLDGPLWLRRDRDGGVTSEGGRLLPPAPGFWGGG